jgi:hypothetical protein
MEQTSARIHISAKDGIVEITGSESFVTSQMESLKPLIEGFASDSKRKNKPEDKSAAGAAVVNDSEPLSKYPNTFGIIEDKLSILKEAIGDNIAEKELNTVILYLFGKSALGVQSVPFSELREVCKAHSCLDATNFSSHMKAAKAWILVAGKGKSQNASLSVPGKAKAIELITNLESA